MCIAIANEKGNPLSDQELTNCWENNPDGAGILYKESGMLKVYKQQSNLEKFKKKYFKVIESSNCLVHFRVKSAGVISLSNIHPFMVNKNLGFIHNGTITKMPKDDTLSDTQIFNQAILKNLPKDFTDNPAILELMEDYCGYSKLVFMDKSEMFTIINEDKGSWSNGNWFSNDSYKRVNNYYYRGSEKVSKETTCALSPTKGKQPAIKFPPAYTPSQSTDKDPWTNYEEYYEGYTGEDIEFDESDLEIVTEDPWLEAYEAWVEEMCDVLDQVDYQLIEARDYDTIMTVQVMMEDEDDKGDTYTYMRDCKRAIERVNEKHDKTATFQGCVAIFDAQEMM